MNPFARKRPNPKRDKPRRVGNGRTRLRGEAMTDLRRQAFERSGGKCEFGIPGASLLFNRCNRPITWKSMELSHDRHGPNKSDTLATVKAVCHECHQIGTHNPKSCKRRAGKPMSKKNAEAYWNSTACFCEKESKRSKESFGPECRAKVSAVTLHTLENTDDPDVYRETLAQAEIEILKYGIERPSGAGNKNEGD